MRVARDLIGRRAELKTLEDALAAAMRGRLQLALLSGPAGMGKSALVRRSADAARDAGAQVVIAECAVEDSSRPFGPLLHAPDGGFAEAIETRAGARPALFDAADGRHRAFAAITERLRVMARERPVVLVMEDVQWSDEETLHLLPYLSRRAAEAALVVVATFRTDDAGSGILARTVVELRGRDALEIELGPLTPVQVGVLIRSALGSTDAVHSELRSFVAEHSGGNPLFVEELVRALFERGWLVRTGGLWRPARPLAQAVMPTSFGGSVRARVELMPVEVRRILSAAAVIGQRYTFDLLLRVAGSARDAVVAALHAGIDAGMIEETHVGRSEYSFRHALIRDALLDGMIGPERQDIHLAVARSLEAASPEIHRSTVAPELAHHFDAAGDAERAVRYHLMAVRASSHGAALGELIPITENARIASHLERALALAPLHHPDRAEMLRVYAWAQEDPACRLPLIEESLAHAERTGDRRGVALSTVMAGAWRAMQSDRSGIATIRDGISRLEGSGSGSDLAEAYYQLARFAMLAGNADTVPLTEHAIELARKHGLPVLVAHGLITLGTRLIGEGRLEGIAVIRDGLSLAHEHSAKFAVMRGLTNLWLCLLGSSAPDDEIRHVERTMAQAIRESGMAERPFEILLMSLFLDHRWDDALELIDEMSFPPFTQSHVAALIRSYVGVARKGPAAFVPDVLSAHERVRFGSQPAALAPEILYLAGDHNVALETARRDVARALDGHMTREFVNTTAVAGLAAAVAVHNDGAVEEWIERCARRHPIEASTAEGRRAYAEGERALRCGRREEALEAFARSAQGFERRGATLLARTLPRLRRAELLAAEDVAAAQRELGAVLALWRAVGAKWYLGQLQGWASVHGLRGWTVSARRGPRLTPRELEVARAVAEGLTNKEIGARLDITERTAETHVQRILTKLDLRGRAQLGAWVAGPSGVARTRT